MILSIFDFLTYIFLGTYVVISDIYANYVFFLINELTYGPTSFGR